MLDSSAETNLFPLKYFLDMGLWQEKKLNFKIKVVGIKEGTK